MRTRLNRLLNVVSRWLPRPGKVKRVRKKARVGLQVLEDRLAPAGGFAAGQWPQPGGANTPVTVTYSYSNLLNGQFAKGIGVQRVRATIEEALRTWAKAAPFHFIEVADSGPAPSSANYSPAGRPMIRFGYRKIDGTGGTIGLGYFPGRTGLSGDVHFDVHEKWTLNSGTGPDLLECAVHEIGHALGLDHVGGVDAIMNPVLKNRYHGLGTSHLLAHDVNTLRAKYGSGTGLVRTRSQARVQVQAQGSRTFAVQGNTLYVVGGGGNDTLQFIPGTYTRIAINGVTYRGSLASIRRVVFNGQGGRDRFIVAGSSGVDQFIVSPSRTTLVNSRWNVTAASVESIDISGSANDLVTLADTPGNDTFSLSSSSFAVTSSNYVVRGRGIGKVTVAASGGTDRAYLYGTSGNETVAASSSQTVLTRGASRLTAKAFEQVVVFGMGGSDRGFLYDSAGDETFTASRNHATLSGGSPWYSVTLNSFAEVSASARGGTDTAYLYGTAGNDTLYSDQGAASLYGAGIRFAASGFDKTEVWGAGGYDQVYASGSADDDQFTASSNAGTLVMAAGTQVKFQDFESAQVANKRGGDDRKFVGKVGYRLSFNGSWS